MVCARSASSSVVACSGPRTVPLEVRRVTAVWMFSNGVGGLTLPSLWKEGYTPASNASRKRCHGAPTAESNICPSSRSPQ